MKKQLIAMLLAAACVFIAPVSVKADAALDAAQSFNTLQNNYLTQQNAYYNNYQVPVMTQYNQAMSNQISQSLAAIYQAQLLQQQAQQRVAVNAFQMNANFATDTMNFQTQMMNMANQVSYNSGMQTIAQRQMLLSGAANTWGTWMGQYPFPQYP